MKSNNEEFFTGTSFAVVGNSTSRNFPKLTYNGLKSMNKQVVPIDPSLSLVDGDRAYDSFSELPIQVDRVIIEVQRDETMHWLIAAVDAGVKDNWIHQGCETEEVVEFAEKMDINLRRGNCAVMYVKPEFTYHSIHRWIIKLLGKY